MSARFLELDALAYDYQAALERQNLKQEDVNRLRERIKSSEYVPQFIMDRQVGEESVKFQTTSLNNTFYLALDISECFQWRH